ncbi:DeoR/GlpR family DNA-binding transcription regulator [Rhodoluna limnophila]|uniref:DeoR/GlpR family DNA-binding transcription regulator n=1 Tax=Rhodoluna limnophila TaxID=232537 RepID=UPI00110751D8|nr:DeoR/GlpR family DNA-binding transcription regulator [Rhodoluna limnophila]
MLAAQRQGLILKEVADRGAARISELAEELNVSEMTVRRDIDLLAEQGLVDKVHGGATAIGSSSVSEPPFTAKSLLESANKDAIAAQAAKLVQPGAAIALMGGSTVYSLARKLADIPLLTVVTNSLPVSDFLHREGRSDQTVILTGGIRTPTDSFVGQVAVNAFAGFNLDLVFMGTHGMHPHAGFSSPNLIEAETNRAVLAQARKLVVLADHTKWGEMGFSTFARIEDADILVTDDGMPEDAMGILRSRISQIELVKRPL